MNSDPSADRPIVEDTATGTGVEHPRTDSQLAEAAMNFGRTLDREGGDPSDYTVALPAVLRPPALCDGPAADADTTEFVVDWCWMVTALDCVAFPPSDSVLLAKIQSGEAGPEAWGRLQRMTMSVSSSGVRFTLARGGLASEFPVPVAAYRGPDEGTAFRVILIIFSRLFRERPYGVRKKLWPVRRTEPGERYVRFSYNAEASQLTVVFDGGTIPVEAERVEAPEPVVLPEGATMMGKNTARSLAGGLRIAGTFTGLNLRDRTPQYSLLSIDHGSVRGGARAAATQVEVAGTEDISLTITREDVEGFISLLMRIGDSELHAGSDVWIIRDGRLTFRISNAEATFPPLDAIIASAERDGTRYHLKLFELWRGAAVARMAGPGETEKRPFLVNVRAAIGEDGNFLEMSGMTTVGPFRSKATLLGPVEPLSVPAVTLRATHLGRAACPEKLVETGTLIILENKAAIVEFNRGGLVVRHLLSAPC